MKPIRRVAVLGAGTMGSRIAAHFANAGFPVDLLDMLLPDQPNRNAAALAGIEAAVKQRPGAFFTEAARRLIRPGNFDDHLDRLGGCDWIIEAVAENVEIKRSLWHRVAEVRKPGSILSTNTSGIPLATISEGFPGEFKQHFLGTHFFNPPRYLHLVEIIPGSETTDEVLLGAASFCDLHLGKGVVECKDTPNFIANRIGCFFGATIHKLTVEDDFTIEEVDALTGPAVGMPKSASFRLIDIVGLDVWCHVLSNLYELVPEDPARELFQVPAMMRQMLERGWLGEKRGQGFYKRVGKGAEKEIHALDRKTMEYHPAQKVRFPAVEAARGIEDLPQRLRTLVAGEDRAGQFLWKLFRDLFVYSATMVPQISERIVEMDSAMRWGFGFPMGPFELWDALGLPETVERMGREGSAVPLNVAAMLAAGARSFYKVADRSGEPGKMYFELNDGGYENLETRPGVLVLSDIKRARGVVKKNAGASLVDLGDGALCLEFHSKMNSLGDDMVQMLNAAIEETSRGFDALVIANQGENFSVGANLMLVLLAAQEGEWDELDAAVRRFQQAAMAIKYAPKPVVSAPFGMALGGGCEIAIHAARVQASAETYMGLVEVGVGLVPAGGGCKEMLLRLANAKAAFELIGYAKVSSSAAHARELGFLREQDGVSMNPERLIADAKAAALAMVPSWAPGTPRQDIPVEGEAGYALLKMGLYLAREGGYISEHDTVVGGKLAHVLSGGRLTGAQKVAEHYLLDLEREAFLSLCGTVKTQERMGHMLKTGKALRN
ncbi:MAG TPA: 3-hydroxyacyl-CoA dehydrogenase NAD-binding domain-containing protein [Candidatus Acidoferrales bacterium]|nr:3-hydroxyacyl-CoA dehydrogenase NAD-binding domain-containing protein [Candidatus Acidoferrales bacterium]